MIQIGKISLKNPLFLAAGCAKFPEDTKKILNSPSAALVVGSITTEPFRTDDGDIMWCDGVRSVHHAKSGDRDGCASRPYPRCRRKRR